MTGTMIFISYLLIGAILGFINHKMFEEVIYDSMVKVKIPTNLRPLFVTLSVMTIIALAPVIGLLDLVGKLKPKK